MCYIVMPSIELEYIVLNQFEMNLGICQGQGRSLDFIEGGGS